jgi:lipoyl(octanoyl) transferase
VRAVIPSEVEESLDTSQRATNTSSSRDITEPLFAALNVCNDAAPHSAAMNMAIDEALLETTTVPTIRFYGWRSPALSFGYFEKFSDVALYANERDLVRRWTGGGIVFHGADLTYSIVIPANDPVFDESSIAIYERIHRALAEAVGRVGEHAELVASARCADGTRQRGVPASYCFMNPVRADVMMDGRKIAGAAQRRTRLGLLQQGSIQGFAMKADVVENFTQTLSTNCNEFEINEQILHRARQLAQQKYGTESWLRKR